MYVSSAQVKPGELMPPMDERRQENNMRRRTLQEVLETSSNMDLLEDEHGELWMVRELLDAFAAGRSKGSEDATPGLTYDSLIFIDGENIYLVSPEGYIDQTPVFRKITPPENPYRVISIDHGYRVVFMEHEGEWKYRLIEGRIYYLHKQAAYRRKDALNAYWRKHNLP